MRHCLFVALLFLHGFAYSQDYPSKTIRLIIPLTPGSGADIAGRIVAHRMNEACKEGRA